MKHNNLLARALRRLGHTLTTWGTPQAQAKEIDYRWGEPSTEEEAIEFLLARANSSLSKRKLAKVILVGPSTKFSEKVKSTLPDSVSPSSLETVKELASLPERTLDDSLLLVSSPSAKVVHEVVGELLRNEQTADLPIEYVVISRYENRHIDHMWENPQDYITPLHVQDVDPFQIIIDSLEKFEAKTGIRDYMDLLQGLNHVHNKGIPGHIAEFGSFKGHSGYLAKTYLNSIGSQKTLYLFDMFETFPLEKIGIDHFWNDTHEVDFDEVKSKFTGFTGVEFAKGEFSKTLPTSGCNEVALAFIDCDAYRSTKYLIGEIFDKRLSTGGIMIFEDYGHANLLGNRLAVHECFEGKANSFQFFSQFSGSYIVCKTA